MNSLDILILIPLVLACFRGFKNGLISEVFSLAALVGGIYLSANMSDKLAEAIPVGAAEFIAIVIIFGATLLGGYIGAQITKKVTCIPDLIDHLCGIIFGAVKVLFICSILLIGIKTIDTKQIILSPKLTEGSTLYPYIERFTAHITIETVCPVSLNTPTPYNDKDDDKGDGATHHQRK